MSNPMAEELKARGNEAFSAKRFEDAIVLYEKAIETNPENYVYYNNRAAAYHELKQYDKAIADAKTSISIEDNARSHARLGAAYWAQSKYKEAKAEFEVVMAMDSTSTVAKENIEKLDLLINGVAPASASSKRRGAPHPYEFMRAAAADANNNNGPVKLLGGEYTTYFTGAATLLLDVLLIILAFGFVVSSLFLPARTAYIWSAILIATMSQQIIPMREKGLIKPRMDVLNTWMSHFSSLLFTLCFFAFIIGVQPILFMPVFIGMYSVIDLISRRREIKAVLGPLYPVLEPHVERAAQSLLQLKVVAASIEALLTFTVMFSGGTMFTLVYIQYGKNRYLTDGFVRLGFYGLRMNVSRMLPAAIDAYAQKFFDLIAKLAELPV